MMAPLILLLLLCSFPLSAQQLGTWERVPDIPGNDFARFWAGDSVVLANYGPQINADRLLVSHDGGATWEHSECEGHIVNIHFGSDGVIVALTAERMIVRSLDGGRHFDLVDTAWGYSVRRSNLSLVGYDSTLFLTAQYLDGQIPVWRLFTSRDHGTSWREIPYPPHRTEILIPLPGAKLIALNEALTAFTAYDETAATWSDSILLPAGTRTVRLGNDKRLYAATHQGALHRCTLDDWSFEPLPLSTSIGQSGFGVMHNGDVVGSVNDTQRPQLIRQSAAGDMIALLDFTGWPRSSIMPIVVVGPDDRLWSNTMGAVFSVTLEPDTVGARLFDWTGRPSIARLGTIPNSGLLVVSGHHIYTSENGSHSFTRIATPYAFESLGDDAVFADSATLLVSSGPHRSTDRGTTWTTFGMKGNEYIRDSAGNLFSHARGALQRSSNRGASWVADNEIPYASCMATFANHVVLSGSGITYHSSDHGLTWEHLPAWEQGEMVGGTVTGAGTFLAGTGSFDPTDDNTVYYIVRSTQTVVGVRHLPCPASSNLYTPFTTGPDGTPYALTTCGIYRSMTDGSTWTKVVDLPEDVAPTALLITEDAAYLGTTEGLYRAAYVSSVHSGTTGPPSPRASIRLLSSSGDASTILLDLPIATRVTIALYDLEGRRLGIIHDGEMTDGEHALPMTMPAGIAAGAYLLLMTTADGETTGVRVDRTTR